MSEAHETTELATINPITAGIETAEKLGDWMARSGMFGCKTAEQGKVMAVTCVVEKITPMEFMQTYHVIDGKPSMRSDAMVAKFARAGGDYNIVKWTNEVCEIEFVWKRNGKEKTSTYSYTIDDAKTAGLVKAGGGWVKTPKNMLFARCMSNGLRAYVPELFAGCYTSEEIRDDILAPAAESKPLIAKKKDEPKTVEAEVVDHAVDTPANADSEPREVAEGDLVSEDEGEEVKLTKVLRANGVKFDAAVSVLLSAGWVKRDDIHGMSAGAIIESLSDKQKETICKSLDGFKAKCEAIGVK